MARNIIISESQLGLIREFENNKVLRYEFEAKVRKYLESLMSKPCNPSYDGFFSEHDIPEDLLQDRMMDVGLIKRTDKITEPEYSNGKKHGVHTRKFIFSTKDVDGKFDRLYSSFFRDGRRVINETDCGGVMGGGGEAFGPSSCGATNAEGVGGRYDVPFGGVQRRNIGTSGYTESNVDKTVKKQKK